MPSQESDMSSSRSLLKRDAEVEHLPARAAKRQKLDTTTPLCETCQGIDLDSLFDQASQTFQDAREGKVLRPHSLKNNSDGIYFYIDAWFAHSFDDRLSQDSSCPLCKFFRSMRIQPEAHERYKLLAFPSSDSWMWRADILRDSSVWEKMKDTVFMAVVPDLDGIPQVGHDEYWMARDVPRTGIIYRLRPDKERKPSADQLACANELRCDANLSLAKKWLGVCRSVHLSACSKRGTHDPVERGFRLISCTAQDPKVEFQPWGTKYAALSYVWGTSNEDKKEWPKTVLDAVAVTQELGLQYLWVDRLCINQADGDEKAYLISRMTTIYEEAELTIVAAAGSGAGHGLPGVGSTSRAPQPKYTLDSGSTLLSSLRDPRADILESEYWTRGWTYQEGVLSNRRLVFTQNQIYWECRNMAAQESMAITLFHQSYEEEYHGQVGNNKVDGVDEEGVMANFMITGIFKGDAYTGGFLSNRSKDPIMMNEDYRIDYGFPRYLEATTHAQLRGLNEHIRAYSKRKLTVDSDALPAFTGITGMYKRSSNLHLLFGLPLWLETIAGVHSGPQITFALTVSAWYHCTGQPKTFASESCHRRTHLPSWSWAGWKGGAVSWRALPSNEHCVQMGDLIELQDVEQSRLLWAADSYLFAPGERGDAIRLRDPFSADRLGQEKRSLIGLHNPLVLKYFRRKRQTAKEWTWARFAGREGRDRRHAESYDWDKDWHRIAGRLCCVCLSIDMSEEDWTAKHERGEIISVLMFACRYLAEEHGGHGGARFLTLRKVEGAAEERWERIGTLFLTIPKVSLDKCSNNQDFLKQIPVRERQGMVVIQ